MLNLIITMILLMATILITIFIKKATKTANEEISRFMVTSMRRQINLGEADYDAETSVISWLDKQRAKRLVDYSDNFERK